MSWTAQIVFWKIIGVIMAYFRRLFLSGKSTFSVQDSESTSFQKHGLVSEYPLPFPSRNRPLTGRYRGILAQGLGAFSRVEKKGGHNTPTPVLLLFGVEDRLLTVPQLDVRNLLS